MHNKGNTEHWPQDASNSIRVYPMNLLTLNRGYVPNQPQSFWSWRANKPSTHEDPSLPYEDTMNKEITAVRDSLVLYTEHEVTDKIKWESLIHGMKNPIDMQHLSTKKCSKKQQIIWKTL